MTGLSKISISRIAEEFSPAILATISLLVLIYYKSQVMNLAVSGLISITNLYNAIFNWSAIQTGCLFAIYGFVTGSSDGFMGEIRGTYSMKKYSIYIKRATYAGFILTFISIPLIVIDYKMTFETHMYYYTIILWFSLFIWAFFSFLRVAYIFGIMVSVDERRRTPGN